MRERLIELRERRARLLRRANDDREAIAAFIARTDVAMRWVEAGRALAADLRRHPLWLVAGFALLVALRPRGALKLLASGWSLVQLLRSAQLWWLRIAPLLRERAKV